MRLDFTEEDISFLYQAAHYAYHRAQELTIPNTTEGKMRRLKFIEGFKNLKDRFTEIVIKKRIKLK